MQAPSVILLDELGRRSRAAARRLALTDSAARARAVERVADAVGSAASMILAANAVDIAEATEAGLTPALIDRLRLDAPRLDALIADTRRVAHLPDPVGALIESRDLDSGVHLSRVRVPLGVVGVIYEARPNVTLDIAALCLRTANASILRGGKETIHTNRALMDAIRGGLKEAAFPADSVQFIDSPDRALVEGLLRLDRWVDMIIPRGGAGLHALCRERATIPVITGGIGVCHLFVDESADLDRSLDVIENAKVQRPTVCNALDTVLVHEGIAERLLPRLADRLAPQGVDFVADSGSMRLLGARPDVRAATDGDFAREWLRLTLGVRMVDSLADAVDHIAAHGTGHSDGILTESAAQADRFVAAVDSAAVYVNASTRFTDGGQFGLGAEVAVSTQKLHARGPMGLEALTTYKWVGRGDYSVRP